MSYYAELDNADKTGGDVATMQGWSVFCQWIESLDLDLPQLRQLASFGWSQNLDGLEADLKSAIDDGADADNADVANGLLAMLAAKADAEVICVTDGCGVDPDKGEALGAAKRALQESLSRMSRIEANEATKAAKDPSSFVSRLDAFYEKHHVRIVSAIEPPLRTLLLVSGDHGISPEVDSETRAKEHIGRHKTDLLLAAECKPAELPERVAKCVEGWK